jgi:hypothetical protein
VRVLFSTLLVWFSFAGVTLAQVPVSPPRADFVKPASDGKPAVTFEVDPDSDHQELTLYVQREVNPVLGPGGSAETGKYTPLCGLPCTLDMRSGSYVLGLAAAAGPTVKIKSPIKVNGAGTFTLGYDDRKLPRVVGWLTLLIGAGGGGVLLAHGQAKERTGEMVTGAVMITAAIGLGLWLANWPDRGYVRR